MKKKYKAKVKVGVLGSLLLGAILIAAILAYVPVLAQLSDYNPQGLKATTLKEVLALPDEEIDLATAIMILCKEWDPSVDVTGPLEEIDRMALELGVMIDPKDSPERIVNLVNQYFFEENAYSDLGPTGPRYMETFESSALPSVIENKKGDCLGLSLLYLAVTERLGLPFYGVAAPGHIFVRYDDGKKRINIETTDKGEEGEDNWYEKRFMLHPTYRKYNFYLGNLLKREVIGVFLNSLGATHYEKGMYDEAIAEVKRALELNPNDADAHYNLGATHYEKGMYDEAIAEVKRALELNPNHPEAHYRLGVAYQDKGMYDKEIGQ